MNLMLYKKWYILGAVIVLIFIGIYLTFNRPKKFTNYPPQNNTIVAFGDSLIEGVGATDGRDFVSLYSKKIDKPIINLGRSGDTTAQGLARVSEILNRNPGIVIILLGGNDYIKKVPEKETFSNLGQIIDRLQQEKVFVILLGVRGGILSDNFEKPFKKLAKEKNVLFVPNVLDGLLGNPKYMSDTVHPNNQGYAKMTEMIFDETARYVLEE